MRHRLTNQRIIRQHAKRLVLPLDLGVAFLGAWSMYPLSKNSNNLFVLRNSTTTAEATIARLGYNPNLSAISSHLGANAGTVKTLYDQVSTNNATQSVVNNQPIYEMYLSKASAAQRFASGQKWWDLPSAPSLTGRNFTIYNVWAANDRTYSAISTIPNAHPLFGASSAGTYNSNDSRSTAHIINVQWGTFPQSSSPMPGGNCSINIGVIRSNATNTRFRCNEVATTTSTLTDTSTKALTYLGRQGGPFYVDGGNLIATLIGPAHTQAEEGAVVASLRSLFSTQAKTKLVLFDGDSITAGHNETTSTDWRDLSWPYECMNAIGDQTVMASNRAISSSQIVDGTGNANKDLTVWAPYKLDAQLNTVYSKKVLVIFAGRNDIAVINAAGAGLTTYNRLVSYCQARKAAGWLKIIVVNAIPAKDLVAAGIDAERTDYNSRIAANNLTDWDAVVDVASLAWKPSGSSDWSTNYQGTAGIHPNAAGRTLIANAVKPVLESFL